MFSTRRRVAAAIGIAVGVGIGPLLAACSEDDGGSPSFSTTSDTQTSSPATSTPRS